MFFAVILTIFTRFFTHEPILLAVDAIACAILVLAIFRLGLLSVVAMGIVIPMFVTFPATLDLTRWYAGIGIIGPMIAVALAGWGFWVALAGRPIFRDSFTET